METSLPVPKGKLKRDSVRDCSDRTRDNGFKVKEGTFGLDIRKEFFTQRVMRPLNRFPREAVDALCLEVFKTTLDGALATWSSGRCLCPWQRCWNF